MNKTVETLIAESEAALQPQFAALDAREERLTARVLDLFADEQVALRHFNPTNGYGYDDQGRDTLERIYAKLFRTEAAIVRPQIASGTHALSMCLFGLLRPGDVFVAEGDGDPGQPLAVGHGVGIGLVAVGLLFVKVGLSAFLIH